MIGFHPKACHFLPAAAFILMPGVSNALELLSDDALDQLTAGAATVPYYGQVLPQSMTGDVEVTDTVSLAGNTIHNASETNQVLVSADSQAEFIVTRQLRLGDSAQNHSKALNIANAVGSDLANALNLSTANLNVSQTLRQNNDTIQTELNTASVGLSNWDSGYRLDKNIQSHNISNAHNSFQQEIQTDYSYQHTERFNSVDVAIEKYDPRLLLGEIRVGTPHTEPFTLIPAYNGPCSTFAKSCSVPVGDIVDPFDIFGFIPDKVNYEHGWEKTTLELPEFHASIVSESLVEKDLTIKLTAEPPHLELGAIYLNTQPVFTDETEPRDISYHEIQIPSINLPDISVNLPVANPLYGLEMSINSGFALAGSGEIKGNFGGFNGLATLNVTNVLEDILPLQPIEDVIQVGVDILNTLDFLNIFPDIPGPANLDLDLVITIPIEIDLNPDNLDLNYHGDVEVVESDYPFHIRYDGVFCFQLFGDGECGSVKDKVTISKLENHSFSSEYSEQISFSDSFIESEEQITRIGGQLSGGEAEKIVLSGSELISNESSLIQLAYQSQKHVDSLNVTNASATISANSLNIQTTRTHHVSKPQLTALRLNQSNRFLQQR